MGDKPDGINGGDRRDGNKLKTNQMVLRGGGGRSDIVKGDRRDGVKLTTRPDGVEWETEVMLLWGYGGVRRADVKLKTNQMVLQERQKSWKRETHEMMVKMEQLMFR